MIPFMIGKMTAKAAAAASATGAEALRAASGKMADVDDRLDRLVLVVEALWNLLKQQGFTDEQLVAEVAALDAADGQADGRRTPAATDCPSCNSKVAAGLPRCQICGTEVAPALPDPFRTV